ncbi:hypothetical protein K439DRAFT_1640853 [Ramaria rubella]|nr:hypothetical protein K439DRAFT_1640853 [Ramaria rubella]
MSELRWIFHPKSWANCDPRDRREEYESTAVRRSSPFGELWPTFVKIHGLSKGTRRRRLSESQSMFTSRMLSFKRKRLDQKSFSAGKWLPR